MLIFIELFKNTSESRGSELGTEILWGMDITLMLGPLGYS